jgi:uncharacterized protein
MKFTLESTTDRNVIRAYASDGVRIGSRYCTQPLLVSATELIPDWPAGSLSTMTTDALDSAPALCPRVILFGGEGGSLALPRPIRAALQAAGVACEVMALGAACRTYNVLLAEERAVVAALFPRKTT